MRIFYSIVVIVIFVMLVLFVGAFFYFAETVQQSYLYIPSAGDPIIIGSQGL